MAKSSRLNIDTMGGRIKVSREGLGWSQQRLADALVARGVKSSRSTVAGWEAMGENPSIEALKVMADLFNTTSDYLITISDSDARMEDTERQFVVVGKDSAERQMYEEWIEILQDVEPDGRRAMVRAVRALASQFSSALTAGQREELASTLFDVLWEAGGDEAVENAIRELRKSMPEVSVGLVNVSTRRKPLTN